MSQEDINLASARTYQFIGFIALSVVFLAQLQQGLLLGNLLVIAFGVLGLVSRLRLGHIIFLIMIAGAQLVHQALTGRFRFTSYRLFELEDVLLCVGVLGYVAAHYRLQGLMTNLLTLDPRQRSGSPRRFFFLFPRAAPIQPVVRPLSHINQTEITLLALGLPVWALLAQLLLALLSLPWEILDLPVRMVHMLLVTWTLILGTFVLSNFLNLWKRRQMTAGAAQLYLQDTLWRETRGDQRRLNRWLAWKKINQTFDS
jgi:hypothetical protein